MTNNTNTNDMVDLEKQDSDVTRTSSSAPSESEQWDNPADLADTTAAVAKGKTMTTFAPMKSPNYNGAGASPAAAAAAAAAGDSVKRNFSRRDSLLHRTDSHLFGGDMIRHQTELHLTHFESQQGKDVITVHWEGDGDMENPQNWSRLYRWYITFVGSLLVLNSTFTSSAPSGVAADLAEDFGFSRIVGVLTVSLFVGGYCLGPLVWGPLSERVGRKPVFVVAMACYTGMNIGCALSNNTASILIFRFLAGAFGASPLTNAGGLIADIWEAKTRGDAMALFSVAPFAGPAVGPIVGGFIHVSGTSWRWLFWVCSIFSGLCFLLAALTLPETYAPIILQRKAARIRKETKDERYQSPRDLLPAPTVPQLISGVVSKPFVMLFQEPMLLAITVYMSFTYGLLYLLFLAYPIVFVQGHGFNQGVSGLMFVAFFLGAVVAVLIYVTLINPQYVKKLATLPAGQRLPPEERLLSVKIAAPALVIALFWFAWTSNPSISFWSPMLAGSLLGFAMLFIFVGLFNYIVDAYTSSAASALSSNTVCRSAFGAGFPLFATQMFTKLGTPWAASLLGFLALLMVPIPFILSRYGARIRAMSKHAAD